MTEQAHVTDEPAPELSTEDAKLVTLARATRARVGAAEGAAVRDTDGRTYAAATVDLPSLRLSAPSRCAWRWRCPRGREDWRRRWCSPGPAAPPTPTWRRSAELGGEASSSTAATGGDTICDLATDHRLTTAEGRSRCA